MMMLNNVDGDGQDQNNDCDILYDNNCDSPPLKERLFFHVSDEDAS